MTTADECVHTIDTTQLDFAVGRFVETCRDLSTSYEFCSHCRRNSAQQLVASAVCMHMTFILAYYYFKWVMWVIYAFVVEYINYCIVDSAPSLGVHYFLSLTLSIRLSVCFVTLLLQIDSSFCFSMESSHFLAVILHVALYKTVFFDFWFRPLMPKIYSPKFACWSLSEP